MNFAPPNTLPLGDPFAVAMWTTSLFGVVRDLHQFNLSPLSPLTGVV